jgi:arylsulfatase A-like enzyme
MKKSNLSLLSIILLFSVFITGACNNAGKVNEKNPNIVLILADDMGYGDAGSYNPDSKIPTPNIDNLASEGIRFTDAHTPASVCTPTRYGLLTGRYCWRTRLKKWVILGYDETPLIEQGRETLGSLLKKSGYETACIGKWHVGLNWEAKGDYVFQDDSNKWQNYSGVFRENEENVDFTEPVSGGPNDMGFDYSFITAGCSTSDNPYCFIENQKTVGIPSVLIPEKWIGLPGVVTALMVPDWSMEEVDPIFTGKALNFIDQHMVQSPDKPFFLYLALSSPHIPWLPPDFTKGESEEGARGDLIMVVDWAVGEINKTLVKHGIAENTMLIFTSDNGPRKGSNGHLSAGPFRGYKGNIWEGGHRVPFIVRWPGHIEPGSVSDKTISLTDMLASFADLTGKTLGTDAGEDSYNVMPAILGQANNDKEEVRVFHSASGVFAVRKGKWKLIEGTKGSGSGNINLTPDSLINVGQLYNLETDPYEQNDLYDQEKEIVKELQIILQNIKKDEG